ncbi:MAG: hypothetical protein KBE65_16840 [Phycisphaerae bacterium]|nr:hypothetical protein [Phycisphaerae bacterium]
MYWLGRNAAGTERIRCDPMARKPASPVAYQVATAPQVRGSTCRTWGRFHPLVSRNVVADRPYRGSYVFNN